MGAKCRSGGPFIALTHHKGRVGEAERDVRVTPTHIFDKASQIETIPSEDDVTIVDAASEHPWDTLWQLRAGLVRSAAVGDCATFGARRGHPRGYRHCVEKRPWRMSRANL